MLGVVKFRFPNKHDVYMHDTPTKNLFSAQVRTFSHGCMRVQNPVRLAEIVLAEDKKMASDKVRAFTALRRAAEQSDQPRPQGPGPHHLLHGERGGGWQSAHVQRHLRP